MKVFILAGGFATRLWPLTEKRAKPLLPLAGRPLLSHLIERIPRDLPVSVSTNAAFGADMAAWANEAGRPIGVVVEQTRSEDEKLGTTGAFAQWIETHRMDDDVLLVTGDNYLEFDLHEIIALWQPGTALLVTHDLRDPALATGFGTVLLADDGKTVTGFEEKPAEPKTSLVSTGCMIFPKESIPAILAFAKDHPDHIGKVFEELLRRGMRVTAVASPARWFDVGSFDAYLDATRSAVGQQALIDGTAAVERSILTGSVVIGRRSRVTGAELENVVVFDDVVIEDCILRDCVVDDGCRLKGIDLTGKMLRAGTILER